jgi:CheY-like chemotaxis protein
MIELVEHIVKTYGIDVDYRGVVGEQDGIKSARTKKPDLILLSLSAPEHDEYATFERIKADDMLKNIPVILVYTPYPTWREAPNIDIVPRKIKPDSLLKRPVDPYSLAEAIRKILQSSSE